MPTTCATILALALCIGLLPSFPSSFLPSFLPFLLPSFHLPSFLFLNNYYVCKCCSPLCAPCAEALLRDPDCGVPLAGIQASIDFSTITVNSVATYTCIRGHVAVAGDHNRTCMDFGRWTGSPLNCTCKARWHNRMLHDVW